MNNGKDSHGLLSGSRAYFDKCGESKLPAARCAAQEARSGQRSTA